MYSSQKRWYTNRNRRKKNPLCRESSQFVNQYSGLKLLMLSIRTAPELDPEIDIELDRRAVFS